MMADSTYTAAPFGYAKADIILRSSGNIDFRVFKLFLSLASPFFEILFELPQPAETSREQEIKDDLVVVRVPENNKILDTLLRFCYPCTLAEDPKLEVLKDVVDVLEAARKYSLDAIERKVCRALPNPKILAAEPLRCFAIARRGRAHEKTLLAAKYTLTQPLIPAWFQEIALITSSDLLALLSYHQSCGNAVYALRNDMSWIKSHYGSSQGCAWISGKYPGGTCTCPKSLTPRYLLFEMRSLRWWDDFMEETFVALRDKPCRATVESIAAKTVQSVKARNCPGCSVNTPEGMRAFSELLTRKAEEVISKVCSDIVAWRSIFVEFRHFFPGSD